MEPTETFWNGVGASVGTAPGWVMVAAIFVIGICIIIAKYIYPGQKEIRMRELDIREREAENDSSRIEANEALAEQTRSCRESVDVLATQQAAMLARLDESADRSHGMNQTVEHIATTADRTATQVDEIHRILSHGPENSD